jgi:hypothetical protein
MDFYKDGIVKLLLGWLSFFAGRAALSQYKLDSFNTFTSFFFLLFSDDPARLRDKGKSSCVITLGFICYTKVVDVF